MGFWSKLFGREEKVEETRVYDREVITPEVRESVARNVKKIKSNPVPRKASRPSMSRSFDNFGDSIIDFSSDSSYGGSSYGGSSYDSGSSGSSSSSSSSSSDSGGSSSSGGGD